MRDAFINARDMIKTSRSKSGPVHALDGLSLTVPQGSVGAIPGPNREGKTTTVKVPTTLVRPNSGDVRIAGIDILKHPLQSSTAAYWPDAPMAWRSSRTPMA